MRNIGRGRRVTAFIATDFDETAAARAQWREIADQLRKAAQARFPGRSRGQRVLACMTFSAQHRAKFPSNPIEHLDGAY